MVTDERPDLVCEHVLLNPSDLRLWFTGRGLARNWACVDCAKTHPEAPAWCAVDDAWWTKHADDAYCGGAVGQPEALTRETDLAFVRTDVALSFDAEVVDFQPCSDDAAGCWFLLSDGWLLRVDLASGGVTRVRRPKELGFALGAGCGLRLSPVGDYAAIFEVSGSLGVVVDLRDGRVVRRLHRGSYRPQNSFFPVAFARRDDRTLLVTGSEWNRLDLIDVAADRVLSERTFAPRESGGPPPEHYLDYFHGSLAVSPDGAWIIDSGWIWHPVGVVRAWSLDAWQGNVWESEDGPTLRGLATRDYYWDGPACWVDKRTVALWGYGDDDEWLVPSALLIDAREGRLLRWFAGPRVRPPRAWPPRVLADSLVFDGYLFAIHDEAGTTVWDVATGERVCADATLRPTRYHRGMQAFLTRTADGVRLSRRVGGAVAS